jgi:hypothetical protein
MTPNEKLLVLTICELLGKSVDVVDVDRAYEDAKRKLEQSREPPRKAEIFRQGH